MTVTELPDILDGYALVGTNNKNSWRTEIRSLLMRKTDTESDTVYLTHECRAESVGASIFRGKLYEFAVVSTGTKNFALRYGGANYGLRARSRKPVIDEVDFDVNAYVPQRAVKLYDLDAALNFARNGDTARLFMKIEYTLGDASHTCITPCRYINFPNTALTDEIYIQPISGYTIFDDGTKLMSSYIAAYVSPELTNIEVISRDLISLLDVKCSVWRAGPLFRFLLRPLSSFFLTDEFHNVTRLNGRVEFFTYE
jgi:hypothetical protein